MTESPRLTLNTGTFCYLTQLGSNSD